MNCEIKSLGTVATYVNGRAFKPDEWESDGLPIIRIQNLTDSTAKYNFSSALHDERFRVQNGDLLFAWSASLGAHIWRGGDAWLNQHIFKVIPNDGIEKMYLYYYLCNVVAELYSKTHGSGMVHITKGPFMSTPIPIPAVTEQKFIVARIEELFSELDNGVETLRKTKQQLAVYRQAVLKAAFDTNNAEAVELSEIVDSIRIGPFGTMLHKTDYVTGGIPVVNPQHIKGNTIVAGEKVTISKEKAAELSVYKLRCNDVIMGRRGEMGRCAAVTQKEEGWICGTGSIVFRLKPEFDAAFYAKILSSPNVVRYLEENATGTTMKNLNEEIVRHIPVPRVTRQQQAAISRKIDASLSVCDNIEATVDTSLQQAVAMRQSILKQTFEGK